MNTLKLVLLLIALPLLLAVGGSWELQRAENTALELQGIQADLATARPTLEQIAAQSHSNIVELDNQKMGVLVALSKVQTAEGEVHTLGSVNAVMHTLAIIVIALGLAAALVGVLALGGITWAGALAMQSRAKLLQVFALGSRLLPFVLVGHIAAMAAAVALVLTYEGLGLWHAGRMSSGEFKLMLAAGMIALVCLYTIWQVLKQLRSMLAMFEPEPMPMLGRQVSPSEAPGLWAYVQELAAKLQALPPEHIVVSLAEGFYVTSSDAIVYPAQTRLSGRTLHIPLLYLGLLDRAETGAVIGHELAHFAGEDTAYSLRFLPIYDGVGRSIGSIAQTMLDSDALQARIMQPSFLLGVFFMERFDHAVKHWSRDRELHADAAGARLVGNGSAASALVRYSAIDPRLDELLGAHLEVTRQPGAGATVASDLPGAMITQLQQARLELPSEELEARLPHPTDSHPTNVERLAALQVAQADAIASGTRPVDAQVACRAMDSYFSAPQPLREALTKDLVAQVVTQETAYTEALTSQAQAVEGDRVLHEGARTRGISAIVFAVILLAIGVGALAMLAVGPAKLQAQKPLFLILAGVMGFLGLLFVWVGVRLVKRAHQPALRLTPEHFIFTNLAAPLPITDIAEVSLQIGQGTIITVRLEPEAPLPQLVKGRFGEPGAKLNKKKRLLHLQLIQVCINDQALKPQAALELLSDYVNAAHARGILLQRQG